MSIIRTRRQTAAKNEHLPFHNHPKPIPFQHDFTTFYLKRTGSIDDLPIQIFQSIREYLKEHEYRNLMNTSLIRFQSIRYETIHYTFKGPNKWCEINSCTEEDQMEYLQQSLVTGVKNKSKQISMIMFTKDYSRLTKYRKLIEGIFSFRICGNYGHMNSNFDFTILRNIFSVHLANIRGIGVIHCGLENVQYLTLKNLVHLKEIKGINKEKKLKRLIIEGCRELVHVPPLDNIEVVHIEDTSITNFISTGGHTKFLYVNKSMPISVSSMKCIEKFISLKEIVLNCGLSKHYSCNLSNLASVQSVTITQLDANAIDFTNPTEVFFPSAYYGCKLYLKGFRLPNWNFPNLIFPYILQLSLFHCYEVESLPEMPQLRELTIENCKHLRIIRSFPKLTSLRLALSHFVERIENQTCCLEAHICDCNHITELYGLLNCDVVSVNDCAAFSTVASLRNVRVLSLIGSFPSVTSFAGFEVTKYPTKRIVTLSGFINLKSIEGLKNCSILNLESSKIRSFNHPIESVIELSFR